MTSSAESDFLAALPTRTIRSIPEKFESFTTTYPKKVYSGALDFGKTLKEAGLVPSAVLIVK